MSSARVCAFASASHRVLCGRCVGVLVYVRGPQSLPEAWTPGLGPSSGRASSRAFSCHGSSHPAWGSGEPPRVEAGRSLALPPRGRGGGEQTPGRLLQTAGLRGSRSQPRPPLRGRGSSPELSWPCPAALGPCYSASVLTSWYLRGGSRQPAS